MHPLLLLVLTAAAVAPQDEAEKNLAKIKQEKDPLKRLKALYALRMEPVLYLTANSKCEKSIAAEGRNVATTSTFSYRSNKIEKKERAVLWDELEPLPDGQGKLQIKTLVKDAEAVVLYPQERTALVYDLSRDRNFQWQILLLVGISDELERWFKITVLKDPEPPGAEAKPPKPEPEPAPREAGDPSAAGLGGPTKGGLGIDIYDLNFYVLELVPRNAQVRDRISRFTVWVDPQTCRMVRIFYTDLAGEVRLTLDDYKSVESLDDSLFEIDLEDPKLKVRRR